MSPSQIPRRLLARLRPRSVAGQIALLVVAAIVVAHAVATLAFVVLREPWRPDDHPGVAANRLATVARLLDVATPTERSALLRHAAQTLPGLRIAPWAGAAATPESSLDVHPVVQRLRDGFGQTLAITDLAGDAPRGILRLGVATPGGATFQASLPDDPLRPPKQGALIFTFVFLGLTLALLSVWATRALTAPLARLAGAAEAFGTRNDPVPLPQRGPEEVLAVSRALDRMRERVRRLIDDRTQMLAAISHDLRTPITRLRLRAEFIEDDHARTMTLRDLDQMNGLVEAALSFVRDGQGGAGTTALVDLASVVQTVCDGFSDIGADVQVARSRHVLVRGRPDELQRAITNLVDNAVKYGGTAVLSMEASPRGIAVAVRDSGPGIPEAERDAMLQPFVRGDRARNLNEASGFGLGLSIVLAIVEAHQGRLVLDNIPEGGLCARIELPLAVQAPQAPAAAPAPGKPALPAEAA
ncbi:MAG TPA: ATP-binding protein [Methylobacterium sp.]|nr:ATP-binding protein [Methylobacterium sp.]